MPVMHAMHQLMPRSLPHLFCWRHFLQRRLSAVLPDHTFVPRRSIPWKTGQLAVPSSYTHSLRHSLTGWPCRYDYLSGQRPFIPLEANTAYATPGMDTCGHSTAHHLVPSTSSIHGAHPPLFTCSLPPPLTDHYLAKKKKKKCYLPPTLC